MIRMPGCVDWSWSSLIMVFTEHGFHWSRSSLITVFTEHGLHWAWSWSSLSMVSLIMVFTVHVLHWSWSTLVVRATTIVARRLKVKDLCSATHFMFLFSSFSLFSHCKREEALVASWSVSGIAVQLFFSISDAISCKWERVCKCLSAWGLSVSLP